MHDIRENGAQTVHSDEIASPDRPKTNIELLIAIVKYRTVIKRIRQGVCTRYVASLRPGQQISVTLQRGGLGVSRTELDRPVVMIGPGTGVAPMRALIYERLAWRQNENSSRAHDVGMLGSTNGQNARDVLFFGCRNANADFFFDDEWESLKREGVALDIIPAFSRDQV